MKKPSVFNVFRSKISQRCVERLMSPRANIYCALLSLAIGFSCRPIPPVPLPNLIIINVDDMGWRDVGFMGSQYYETPHIDRLASLGMVFPNGYAAAANCAPSRACLMTGQWTTRHGIYTVGNSDRGESRYRKLIPVENTTVLARYFNVLPAVLRHRGYTTCHAGKWHLSDDPLPYGFDLNIGGGRAGHPNSYIPPYGNIDLEGKSEYLTDLIMEKTLGFLDTVRQPFFLNYAPYAVHVPIQAIDSLTQNYLSKASWNGQQNANYATMIENLDRNIGLMISKLESVGLFDNTLIIFTSDNGGLYGITKQLPLRSGKGSYYEGGIRVPFCFVWNDKIKAGSKNEMPITSLDIFPTFLDAAGIEPDHYPLDGVSLLPVLTGQKSDQSRTLYWHFPVYLQAYDTHHPENRDTLFRTRPGSVVRKGNWKLHYYFENNEVELFNLAEDIGERKNLADQLPGKREELLDSLKNWWEKTNAPIPRSLNPEYGE